MAGLETFCQAMGFGLLSVGPLSRASNGPEASYQFFLTHGVDEVDDFAGRFMAETGPYLPL